MSYDFASFCVYLFYQKSNKPDCKTHRFRGNRRKLW
nr:MAG TPA: hypothetical protein [Caudoviricetes sp.]